MNKEPDFSGVRHHLIALVGILVLDWQIFSKHSTGGKLISVI